MDELNEHEELMKLADTKDLDEQILADLGEDNLLDRATEEQDKKTEEGSPWKADIRSNWFSYLLLGLSFLLTETMAFYLGTAPSLITNPDGSRNIQFNTDAAHLLTTLVYMLVFPAVTELAFWIARKKFNARDVRSAAQQGSMLISALISLISIVGTGVAGAFVVFATLGSVGFLEIPSSVQTWLIWVIPILIAFHGLLHWIYDSNSSVEKFKRLVARQEEEAALADQLRMSQIDRLAKRAIKVASIKKYEKLVAAGLLSASEATEAIQSGTSLVDLEKKLRRDLTGEGVIGSISGLRAPAPASPPPSTYNDTKDRILVSPAYPDYFAELNPRSPYRAYTLSELLAYMGKTPEEAVSIMKDYKLFDAKKAFYALRDNGYLPEDFGSDEAAADRFRGLYSELMGYVSTALPPIQKRKSADF